MKEVFKITMIPFPKLHNEENGQYHKKINITYNKNSFKNDKDVKKNDKQKRDMKKKVRQQSSALHI